MADGTRVRRSVPGGASGGKARHKVAAYLCVAAALLVSGCDQSAASDPTQVVGGSPPAPSAGGPAASGGATGPASPPAGSPKPATGQPGAAAVPDGRSGGILTKVDPRAGTVTFYPVTILTGDAMKQYLKKHPDAADPYYSPAYITVDEGPTARTLPLAATVTVKVIDLDSGNNTTHAIKLADLPAHLATSGYMGVDGRSTFPYYVTVLHGQVTGLQELGVA